MELSVVTPVHEDGEPFRRSLASLVAMVPPASEVIVVSDGASEEAVAWAQGQGARVVRLPAPDGPARARNAGAAEAHGELLLFVDADIVVPRDLGSRVTAILERDPALAAVIGSYDDRPDDGSFLSQYRNLLHHYVHQTSNEEASTFWCGCGVIRRHVFLQAGGFDERYRAPAIEDVELGYRLRRAGYQIRLERTLQVTHLKRWTARSIIATDVLARAAPWTRLILRERRMLNDLNLRTTSRASVALVVSGLGALGAAIAQPAALAAAALSGVLLLALNLRFYQFLALKRGWAFAARSVPWHFVYYACAAVGFAIGVAQSLAARLAGHSLLESRGAS